MKTLGIIIIATVLCVVIRWYVVGPLICPIVDPIEPWEVNPNGLNSRVNDAKTHGIIEAIEKLKNHPEMQTRTPPDANDSNGLAVWWETRSDGDAVEAIDKYFAADCSSGPSIVEAAVE